MKRSWREFQIHLCHKQKLCNYKQEWGSSVAWWKLELAEKDWMSFCASQGARHGVMKTRSLPWRGARCGGRADEDINNLYPRPAELCALTEVKTKHHGRVGGRREINILPDLSLLGEAQPMRAYWQFDYIRNSDVFLSFLWISRQMYLIYFSPVMVSSILLGVLCMFKLPSLGFHHKCPLGQKFH